VLFMLDMLYSVSIIENQPQDCSGQNNVPLPCSKELWEKKSASIWREKYRVYLDSRKGGMCLTFGDLKRLRQSQGMAADDLKLEEDLGEWCKDLENFGVLVFNAALMP